MSMDYPQYTVSIFERLMRYVSPFVPEELRRDMQEAFEHLEHNFELTHEEVEDTIIAFAKKVWPYRKAFDEFVDLAEGQMGEKVLLARMSKELKKRYEAFKACGGTLRDLHRGSPASFFTPEERSELCEALVDMNGDLYQHVLQAINSTEERRFAERVREFDGILTETEERLQALRDMAEKEQEHPQLASEIRAQVRTFEQGLSLLGPEHSFDAVCRTEEHFLGRKAELKMR